MRFKIKNRTYKIKFTWRFPFIKLVRLFNTVKPTGHVSLYDMYYGGIEPIKEKLYKRYINGKE